MILSLSLYSVFHIAVTILYVMFLLFAFVAGKKAYFDRKKEVMW